MQGLLSSERLGNSSMWGSSSSVIKSKQKGVVTLSTTVTNITITSVDLTKAIVRITYKSSNTTVYQSKVKALLTTSTNLQLSVSFSSSINVSWEVIEFNNVKSLQSGNFAFSSSSTQAITSVNTNKTLIYFSYSSNESTQTVGYADVYCDLSSATAIDFSCNAASATVTVSYYVVEFN